MSQFIIEMGGANEHKNDIGYVREMIDATRCASDENWVILKWQLFSEAPPNTPMDWEVFGWAYAYAYDCSFETTASVFNPGCAGFLSNFRVPFTKIACRPGIYDLAQQIEGPVYMSVNNADAYIARRDNHVTPLCCVPQYPADIKDYEALFTREQLEAGVSDHTVGWELYWKYAPAIYEKHFCLRRSKDNPDSGPFAVTPDQLSEVL